MNKNLNNLQSVSLFLASRRSSPPANLTAPHPKRDEIASIATMGLRVPDHKKLEPWRIIALENDSLAKLAKIVSEHAPDFLNNDDAKVNKINQLYNNAGCVLALVFSPVESEGAPEWEQHLSVGAVGISLVNAAIIHGYGAAWLTGFLPECEAVKNYLNLESHEALCGLIHIGTPKAEPPERPRPNIEEKLSFL